MMHAAHAVPCPQALEDSNKCTQRFLASMEQGYKPVQLAADSSSNTASAPPSDHQGCLQAVKAMASTAEREVVKEVREVQQGRQGGLSVQVNVDAGVSPISIMVVSCWLVLLGAGAILLALVPTMLLVVHMHAACLLPRYIPVSVATDQSCGWVATIAPCQSSC